MTAAMTSRERVLASLGRQDCDRLPVSATFHGHLAQRLRKELGVQNLFEHFGVDLRFAWMAETRLERDFSHYFSQDQVNWDEWGRGRIWDPEGAGARYLYPLEHAESLDDLEQYPWPDLMEDYRYEETRAQVEELHAQGYAVYGGPGESLFEIAWQLRSMPQLFEDMLTDSEMATLLLDRITERSVAMARAFARAGVDIMLTGDDVAMQERLLMSKSLYEKWLQPRHQRIIEAAREVRPDLPVWYHSDGKINDLIPSLIDAGVDLLNPVQPECVDHRWVKETYGDRLSFSGGIGVQSVLPFGTPEQVREHVWEVAEILGQGGGLILAPSHMMQVDTPTENVLAMFEAMHSPRP